MTASLLRRKIARSSQDQPGAGQAGLSLHLGDPEVSDLDPAIGPHQDVARFDVAVHDSRRVGGGQCRAHLRRHTDGNVRGNPAVVAQHMAEVFPLEEFHHDEVPAAVLPGVEDLRNVGMVKRRSRSSLPAEPLHQQRVLGVFLLEQLDGHATS